MFISRKDGQAYLVLHRQDARQEDHHATYHLAHHVVQPHQRAKPVSQPAHYACHGVNLLAENERDFVDEHIAKHTARCTGHTTHDDSHPEGEAQRQAFTYAYHGEQRQTDGVEYKESIVKMNEILAKHPKAELDGQTIFLTGEVQTIPLVTDSSITLDIALILPDEQFFYYTQGNYNVYVNGILDQNTTNEMGLMGAYSAINEVLDMIDLDAIGLEYESYLQSMGRQLFYMVAASYITSYLAIIFLVVSNTIIGVQFLMNQQRTGRRYQTLVRLGATYHALCGSARKQITWFMGLPIIVAAISSLFGVKSLFAGILSSEVKNAQGEMLVIAAIIILILCVVECIYMTVIKRSSDRYLLTLMQPQREE